jgi:hypothetical protein
MFEGRNLFIATNHKKEIVIAPLFKKEFGIHCFTSDAFDTDTLGTFSGEIDRKEDPLTTLRTKIILASKATNCDLIVANEGSFGAHPTLFFAHANEELVMLKDFKNDLEIVAREISMETNFNGQMINNQSELLEFAAKVKFPSHGIILKPDEKNYSKVVKGINSKEDLIANYLEFKMDFGTVYAETDMRAMFNPTRMKIIEKATQKLIEKIKTHCPNCETPGFDKVSAKPGLPCENCSVPTRSTLSYLYECQKCKYLEEKMFPRGIQFEDPTYCDNCNP